MRDLAAVWIVVTAVLTYLDVPLQHAPLFAINLVLQASLGVAVITYLLKGVAPSLLLLCGPGLILGGALSFAIFQVVGRGVIGLTVVTIVSLVALMLTLKHPESYAEVARPLLLAVHALGLAALAMSSEFPWLLVVAAASLLVAFILDPRTSRSAPLRLLIVAVYVALLAIATLFRGDYWWLITDDYKFFEVLTRHITRSGPLADWGSLDVSRYHWLSYGWAGLLDFSAGSPDVFVTLTRVMPFVYSAALAMSLLLITEHLTTKTGTAHRFLHTLPVWVLLASFRLDWAATSTGGTYAALGGVVALTFLTIGLETSQLHRLTVYVSFGIILALTKLPSALTLPAIVLGVETLHHMRPKTPQRRVVLSAIGTVFGGVLAVVMLPLLSNIVGNFSVEAKRLPGLLWFYGPVVAAVTVIVRHVWILALIVVTWRVWYLSRRESPIADVQSLILALSPLLAVGIAMESLVAGGFNTYEYFSGPSYFLASAVMMAMVPALSRNGVREPARRESLKWIVLGTAVLLWQQIVAVLPLPGPIGRATFRDAVSDGRILVGFAIIVASCRGRSPSRRRISQPALVVLLLIALIEGVSFRASQLVDLGIRPSQSAEEVVTSRGSLDSQSVGVWLRDNTSESELIATNSLFLEPRSGIFGDDYSLAMWSQREFLVLGPKFFGAAESASEEIDLSIRFGSEPTAADASTLRQRGVRWFVVDTAETDRSTWEPFATVAFRNQRFVVLKLLDEF